MPTYYHKPNAYTCRPTKTTKSVSHCIMPSKTPETSLQQVTGNVENNIIADAMSRGECGNHAASSEMGE